MSVQLPVGSIYLWMYSQGLHGVALEDIEAACLQARIEVRPKDYANYWNGRQQRMLHGTERSWEKLFQFPVSPGGLAPLESYPIDTSQLPDEVERRWVPCDEGNKPMIKWGRGAWSYWSAKLYPGSCYIAENLKGTGFIVIDCDGDHGDEVDWETIRFCRRLAEQTGCHMLSAPRDIDGEYPSFHLTFKTDRVIPTRHFPYARIDVLGNAANTLRYRKDKVWNGHPPAVLTEGIWDQVRGYLEERKER